MPSRVILSSTLSAEQKATLDDIAAHLKDAEIVWEASVTNDATHLVCGSQKRTEKVLQALAKGIWILKWNWIIESMEEGKWLPEERYEANDWFPGAKSGRLSRGTTQWCLLFLLRLLTAVCRSNERRAPPQEEDHDTRRRARTPPLVRARH